jgi:hypothetical protein
MIYDDDLNIFENGKRPQFFEKGRRLIFFLNERQPQKKNLKQSKVKTIIILKMEDDLNFYEKGR